MVHINICEYCGIESENKRKRRFCSTSCSGKRGNSGQFKKDNKVSEEIEKKRIKGLIENHKGFSGKKHSEATKIKMSESSKKPYNYIDGGYYGKIKTNKCEMCGESNRKILIHHKDENRKNNEKSNLLALCYGCHVKLHNSKKYKTR